MAIGPTGVGKSCLMNAIIQGSECMYLDDDMSPQCKHLLKMPSGESVYEIGNTVKSCTQSPGFYLVDDIYFLDCPGLQD